MADETRTESKLVAELNDLLQLDHDAVRAYSLAIDQLSDEGLRETLRRFRDDHERHIRDLGRLIREHDGKPLELAHVPTGFFKLAVQRAGAAGGDREILLAFKANERQVRDKYRRHAERSHPSDVHEVLRRNAADEQRHYDWAVRTLEEMGFGPDTAVGRAEAAFESAHEKAADMLEAGERRMMERAEQLRRSPRVGSVRSDVEREVREHPLRSALVAMGVGFIVGRILS